MELDDMRTIWQVNQDNLNERLKVNFAGLDAMQQQQMKSNLSPLLWKRSIESVFHVLAIFPIVICLINNFNSSAWLIATGTLLAFYIMLLANSIQQIRLIQAVDYSKDLLSIQKAITTLQTHSTTFVRLLFLFLPAILGWPMIVSNLIHDYNLTELAFIDFSKAYTGNWWNVQLIAILIWFPVCFWLFLKVSPKNIDIPWVRNIVDKTMGKKVVDSMDYLNELNK